MNNNNIDNTGSSHNRYSNSMAKNIGNSVSNFLNDDDLTMELSSNNTTIFNYSSNERGGVLASSGNNFCSLNGSNLIKTKRYD